MCWFNPDIDVLFLDSNTVQVRNFPEEDDCVSPKDFPLLQKISSQIKSVAISIDLWAKWPFEFVGGTEATCELCPGFRDVGREQRRKEFLRALSGLENVKVVMGDEWVGGDMRFRDYEPESYLVQMSYIGSNGETCVRDEITTKLDDVRGTFRRCGFEREVEMVEVDLEENAGGAM